ncbi:MAG: divalent metal cation transporter [Aureliella sp.]
MNLLRSIGPALIVAAVVLGPGSILTSSRVGATIGLGGLLAIAIAVVLMISMVILATRVGVVLKGSIGDELAARISRPVAVAVGLVLFAIVALFQSSNNVALVAGVEPLLGTTLNTGARIYVIAGANVLILICLYGVRSLYQVVERAMKVLIGLTAVAFLINFAFVFSQTQGSENTPTENTGDILALTGMIATTFSVAGAFYNAYLVREKGWKEADLRSSTFDAFVSISALGIITATILLTSYRVFYGRADAPELASVADVAKQLEPLFGPWARIIFAGGILGGALSSFLVNALIGGTVLSDCVGGGAKLEDRLPLHLTALALLVGAGVAAASLLNDGSTVGLITLAQALTVIGIPALAAALLFLGHVPEVRAALPTGVLAVCWLGFALSCGLACITAMKVFAA